MNKIEIDYKKLELLINNGLTNKQISEEFNVSIVNCIYEKLIELEVDRHTFILAVGGGIICDIAGKIKRCKN